MHAEVDSESASLFFDVNMKIKVICTGVLSENSLVVEYADGLCFVVDPADCRLSRDEGKIKKYILENNLKCTAIILTHSHFDHVMGIKTLKEAFPAAKICVHEAEAAELSGKGSAGPMNYSVVAGFDSGDVYGNQLGEWAESVLEVLGEQPAYDVKLRDGMKLGSVLLEGKPESATGGMVEFSSADKSASDWVVVHSPGHTPGSVCLYNAQEKCLIAGDTLFDGGWGRTDLYGGDENQMIKSLSMLRQKIPAGTVVYSGHGSCGWTI